VISVKDKDKTKSRRKGKKKLLDKKRMIPIISVVAVVLIAGGIYFLKLYDKKVQEDIRKHFGKYVVTATKTRLFDANLNGVGYVSKDFNLGIEKRMDSKSKYFKIKNTNYYVYYKDLQVIKDYVQDRRNDDLLVFNKNVSTNKKVLLYDEGKLVLELDKGINLPIEFKEKDNYVVYYMDKLLEVKKGQDIKEVDTNNTKEADAKYVSVIHFENISEKCNDYNCVTVEAVKGYINSFKEAGYHFINMTEYEDYLVGDVRLKEKALLLTTSNSNDFVNGINSELNCSIEIVNGDSSLKFNSCNKKSTLESDKNNLERYQIKSYSTKENVLKMALGEEVTEKEPVKVVQNTDSGPSIPVLNYHFFYDPDLGESCNEGICLTVQKFREHLEYLKNNGFKTLTMEEFTKWMYNEIELPEKSVLITIDDGAMGTGKHNGNKLIPLLEEYKMHATLFLITGWWDISNYVSPYLDIQSHTFDMHQYGTCGKGQLNCQPYEEVRADLQKSIDIIGNKNSFCFPFYSYSDRSLQAIKDVGFKIAFVGGSRKANRNNNKYLIPRYPIHNNITMERFKSMVN